MRFRDRSSESPQTRTRVFVAVWAVLALSHAQASASVLAGSDCPSEPGLLQIELREGASIDSVNAAFDTVVADVLHPLYLLSAPPGSDPSALADLVATFPTVVSAEPAYLHETPEGKRQMMVAAVGDTVAGYTDQGAVHRVGVHEAHLHGRGEGVVVAVIDTGVFAAHSQFAGAILPGIDFVGLDDDPDDSGNGLDEDLDGLADDAAGHGTMIAGIVRLVAPGAAILPIRVLDDEGHGRTFDVAKAIRYATESGAHVINLSLGLECVSSILRSEIARADSAGVVVVAAAGNDDAEDPATYPASDPLTLSVAALDSADVKATFASFHSTVSLSAPGTGIVAPFHDGGYARGAGSSFAAPWVAGQAALVLGFHPSLTPPEVRAVCLAGVSGIYGWPENQPYLDKLGTGRVDLPVTWQATPVAVSLPPVAESEFRFEPDLAVRPNPSTTGQVVAISLRGTAGWGSAPCHVEIFDGAGRLVSRLPVSEEAPFHEWDGRDLRGHLVGPGVYFARAASGARRDHVSVASIVRLCR